MSNEHKQEDDNKQDIRRFIPINDVNDPTLQDAVDQENKNYWGTEDVDDDQRN